MSDAPALEEVSFEVTIKADTTEGLITQRIGAFEEAGDVEDQVASLLAFNWVREITISIESAIVGVPTTEGDR